MPGINADVDQSLKSQTVLREREIRIVDRQLARHAKANKWPAQDHREVRAILGLESGRS